MKKLFSILLIFSLAITSYSQNASRINTTVANQTVVNAVNNHAAHIDSSNCYCSEWVGVVSQSTTSAPTATVLKNTFRSAVSLGRTTTGTYTISIASTAYDTLNKNRTILLIGNPTVAGYQFTSLYSNDSTYNFLTYQDSSAAINTKVLRDSELDRVPVILRNYYTR